MISWFYGCFYLKLKSCDDYLDAHLTIHQLFFGLLYSSFEPLKTSFVRSKSDNS